MNYFHLLTEEEVQIICSNYPYKEMIEGFKKYPKYFTAISTFRPQKISEEKGHKLMAENSNSRLVKIMVDSLVEYWILSLTKKINEHVCDGDDEITAQIKAFQYSVLPGCEALFFRLTENPVSKEYIAVLTAAISVLKYEKEKTVETVPQPAPPDTKTIEQMRNEHKAELKEKELENKKIAKDIEGLSKRVQELINIAAQKDIELEHLRVRITQLESSNAQQEKQNNDLIAAKKELESQLASQTLLLQSSLTQIAEQEQCIREQLITIDNLTSRLEEFQQEASTRDSLLHIEDNMVLHPVDMGEFSEYLGYNLSSIGLQEGSDEGRLILDYISDIIFQNKPIICHRIPSIVLAQCISNTLCGMTDVPILSFSSEITGKSIRQYLASAQRVCVLDGFLGNFNELELFPLIKNVRGKIIFLTIHYEHTIAYLPREILEFFNYLNVSKINSLFSGKCTDEDSSILTEEWTKRCNLSSDNKYSRICNEIMCQLGFGRDIARHYSQRISSEKRLVQELAFSILPFACEAFDCSPYSDSKRLAKYAGEDGKCVYKEMLLGWFGDE